MSLSSEMEGKCTNSPPKAKLSHTEQVNFILPCQVKLFYFFLYPQYCKKLRVNLLRGWISAWNKDKRNICLPWLYPKEKWTNIAKGLLPLVKPTHLKTVFPISCDRFGNWLHYWCLTNWFNIFWEFLNRITY